MRKTFLGKLLLPLVLLAATTFVFFASSAQAAESDTDSDPTPMYHTLDELAGKAFAYVNGSVYNLKVQEKIEGTTEEFYPSLAECVAAVEAGKADAAVQLSYCCQLAVNRRGGTIALLDEPIAEVSEGYFFPKGSELTEKFNELIKKYSDDGTLDALEEKWVMADEDGKTLPEQDWDAPNGTLTFATSGVIEPFSYVGEGGEAKGYDVELALLIAKELGYHLDITTIPMDSIFAAVDSGKADFGGTLTETDERAEICDFSDTVMPTTISVIVLAEGSEGSNLEYNTLDELDGKRIGCIAGGVYDKLLQQNTDGTYEFSFFNSLSDEIAALKSGKIDAFPADEPVAQLSSNENPSIGVMPEVVSKDDYGYFFKKGNSLCDDFSEVIESLEADGTLAELKAKWTGADESKKTLPEQDWDTPNGTLIMATSAQLEPMTYMEGTEVTGYDIEVALLVCKELGYGLDYSVGDFAAMLAAVPSGKADFGGGATSITEERKEQVDFSTSEYHGALVMVVRTTDGDADTGNFFARIADSFRKTFIDESRWQLILSGLGVTILISVCSGVLGTLLGFATVLARRSGVKWVGAVVDGFQAIMGGIPLVVVLMVLYYVIFGKVDIAGEIVAIIAFTLAFASTSGSTMWTAITGIDVIQEETGLALGYTSWEVFFKIIYPQAREQFLPQLMGQFVSLVKDTAIVGYIAVQDLTRASDLIRARTMDAFFPLISTALIYFLFCRLLALALERVTARLSIENRPREIEGVEA